MSAVVVLTGSTGNVGTYLLDTLVSNPMIARIHCLNRTADANERQTRSLTKSGLHTRLPNHKVHFHTANLEKTNLGLDSASERLLRDATHYIHCAWPVDWNRKFSSFQPAIQGVSNLIKFISTSKVCAKLFFISSVAAAGNWGTVPGARLKVPEEEIEDWKVARFGYGQSKLVSERLIAEASRASGLTAAICRVGQISGPVKHGKFGAWPEQEWLPSLIKSSKYLRCLPDSLGPVEDVSWVPVDYLSDIITELLLFDQTPGSMVYHHVTNPNQTAWKALLPTIHAALGGKLPIVSLPEWVDTLAHSANEAQIEQNPAVKLLSFFLDLQDKAIHLPRVRAATLDVKHTLKRSSTLRNLPSVNSEWLGLWLIQWGYIRQ